MQLQLKPGYEFQGLPVPNPVVKVDWVHFDRCEGRAEFVLGIYISEEAAAPAHAKVKRLEAVHVIYQNGHIAMTVGPGNEEGLPAPVQEYDELIAAHPEVFTAIVAGVYASAVEKRPDLFELV